VRGVGDPNSFTKLCHGKRLSSSYFDVRYFKGIGTIHMFPRSKELIDRLNRVVGRRRGWLPPTDEQVPKAFWVQYDRAEEFDRELRAEVRTASKTGGYYSWEDPISRFMGQDEEQRTAAEAKLADAMDRVLAKHGLHQALTFEKESAPLLLAA